jgi:hypothetical protein
VSQEYFPDGSPKFQNHDYDEYARSLPPAAQRPPRSVFTASDPLDARQSTIPQKVYRVRPAAPYKEPDHFMIGLCVGFVVGLVVGAIAFCVAIAHLTGVATS